MPNEVNLLPCPTCKADYANENPFCSDGFHAKGPLYWPCDHCGGTGNAHSRPTTIVTDEVVVSAAAAIVDIWMGGDTAWRARLDDSDFLESGDWQTALALARAALASMPTVVAGEQPLQSVGAIPGSHPTDQAPSGLGASRFDPERAAELLERVSDEYCSMDGDSPLLKDVMAFLREQSERTGA